MNSVLLSPSHRALKLTGICKLNIAGTLIWAERLQWSGAQQWLSAERSPVVIDGIIEGYKKTYRNFYFYWLLRSGHMVNTIPTISMPPMSSSHANFHNNDCSDSSVIPAKRKGNTYFA